MTLTASSSHRARTTCPHTPERRPFTVAAVREHYGVERMRPGDIYIMNDPYMGGTHLQDVRLVKPIFLEDEIIGYVATTGHWSDVGGMVPGSFYIEASEIYQEGLRIPPVLIYRDGELNRDVVDLMLSNMRVAHERRGDLNAQIAACRAGENRLLELVEKYELDTVHRAMKQSQDYSERLFRSKIEKIPDGEYEWEDWVDRDLKSGEPQYVHLTMRIAGDQITYDLTGSGPAVEGAINCTYPGLVDCLFVTTKALFPHVVMNDGLLRSMDVIAPENSIVNCSPPSPVGGMAATAFERIISCIFGAWSLAAPERTIAGHYNIINIAFGGRYPDTGEEYVAYVWTEGGIGARATKDGLNGIMSFFSGSTDERRRRDPRASRAGYLASLRLSRGLVRPPASTAVASAPRACCTATSTTWCSRASAIASDLRPGASSAVRTRRRSASTDTRPRAEPTRLACSSRTARSARTTRSSTSRPGGGYGPPEKRVLERIMEDVENEFTSLDFVRDNYGVVIDSVDPEALDYRVDEDATRELRTKLFGADWGRCATARRRSAAQHLGLDATRCDRRRRHVHGCRRLKRLGFRSSSEKG